MKQILFVFFILLCLGVSIDRVYPVAMTLWFTAGVFLSLAAGFLKDRHKTFVLCLLMASVAAGGYLNATSTQKISSDTWREIIHALEGEAVWIEGTVHRGLKWDLVHDGRKRTRLVIRQVRLAGQVLPGGVQVFLKDLKHPIAYGSRIKLHGVLTLSSVPRNPAGFDSKKHLESLEIYSNLYADESQFIGTEGFSIQGAIDRIRNRLIRRFDDHFGVFHAGVVKALFLGERSHLDPYLKSALVHTGSMHLFAISGLHVGLIGFFLYKILSLFRLPERWISVGLILALVFYSALTGSHPPVVRAVMMASVYLAGRVFLRRSSLWNSLGLAGCLILVQNPSVLVTPGFQLSFLAVTGLVYFTPFFYSKEDERRRRSPSFLKQVHFYIKSLIVTSVVAWSVTLPLTVSIFHVQHYLSPLLNVFLIPLVMGLDVLLLVFSLLSFLPGEASRLLDLPITVCIDTMFHAVKGFDQLKVFLIVSRPWSWFSVFLFVLAGYGLTHSKGIVHSRWRIVSVLLLSFNCILFNRVVAQADEHEGRITFFDVGQGDSIFFEFASGGNLLVDTGRGPGPGSSENVITPYLQSRGIRRIDAVVLSHGQFDHCGALGHLMDSFEIGWLISSGIPNESLFYRALMKKADLRGIQQETVRRGDRISGFKDAQIYVLGPTRPIKNRDLNNDSVVLKIQWFGRDILLTGDLEEEGTERLLRYLESDHVDILKVPHHGARLGPQGLKFLRLLRPDVSVIQVGRKNRYGHPHSETLGALRRLSGQVRRTDEDGAIQVTIFKGGVLKFKNLLEVEKT